MENSAVLLGPRDAKRVNDSVLWTEDVSLHACTTETFLFHALNWRRFER